MYFLTLNIYHYFKQYLNMSAKKLRLTKKDFKAMSFTENQKRYSETIEANTITFCWGPAGTSKTFSACYTALQLLAKGEIEKIILTKPIQESGEKLGSLPGDIGEKIAPYTDSFMINMEKMISREKLTQLITDKIIEFKPLAYMRGATFDDAVTILDEAQNCDMKQIMLYVTRLGKNSKAIIAGDVTQHDIAYDKVALTTFINIVSGIKGVGEFVFSEDDIVRSEILKDIVRKYEAWKHSQESNGHLNS
jgi:phosphate starvation-inducible PhoH-like protein